ncbi:sodium- and chloride-dependent GABA transporter 1-like [Chrysoperla carnea]|uniref:sodium- and chloride-dependent GABA transporter 1-like n=1 Tax=Chrysoperla carnea TaxID=189513 RepID=UPI001D0631CC|nr:sodium- and chloride-dependent GABA transporter 1-like [Chrysoperla carnea]
MYQDEENVSVFLNSSANMVNPDDLMDCDIKKSKKIMHQRAGDIEEDACDIRGGWSNKLDFLFSCISLSVGLGNVWRFPYLCYKNGGGAFLIIYGIAMIFCGIPIFYQEVAIGQYVGEGGMSLTGQLCPLALGVGYATMTLVFLLNIYYCVIIAWTLFYLISTFSRIPELPWGSCNNEWNTELCYVPDYSRNETDIPEILNFTSTRNLTIQVTLTTSPVSEFWDRKVLGISEGLNDLGSIKLDLLLYLFLGWILVYFIIRRGLHQSGKIIWFTALFPYVILITLFIRSLMLDGAFEGLKAYFTPRWETLLQAGPWLDGATQIFFAYSSGTGALQALGSYNNFHHNSYKDAIITTSVNTLTSLLAGGLTFTILGHLAFLQNTSVENVVTSGPGLVFLTYPAVMETLPESFLWAAIFFIMFAILGIDSLFCLVESVITGMVDMWPKILRPKRTLFTIGICTVMFLLGIPMTTHGGIYIFQLMDYYSASGISLLWICFFESISISWIFGVDNFSQCISEMTGKRPGLFLRLCWKYFAPFVMVVIFICEVVEFSPLKYGDYEYPWWGTLTGLLLSAASMIWIPGYAIYYLLTRPGTLKENAIAGLTPNVVRRFISQECD